MAFGFKIVDDKHTITDSSFGITIFGTRSFSGAGNFEFTFPLESDPDFIFSTFFSITDASTADTYAGGPLWATTSVYNGTSDNGIVYDNVSGRCIDNDGNIDFGITTSGACSTAGFTWNTENPWFVVFSGSIDYVQIGKDQLDACYTGDTAANFIASNEITIYFYALGEI